MTTLCVIYHKCLSEKQSQVWPEGNQLGQVGVAQGKRGEGVGLLRGLVVFGPLLKV